MKVIQSLLGFKDKKTAILQQRNSILKLLLIINIPNLIILYLVNSEVPNAYMDEEFHYGQFLSYSKNNFNYWDPKITTPPGLYLLQRLAVPTLGNSLWVVRSINALIFGNMFAIFALKVFDFQDPCPNNLSRTLNLVLTPSIYFFNFLDYTDSASIAFLTAMFYYNLIKSQWRLALVSLAAVMIRQNNLIWIGYLIVYRLLSDNRRLLLAPNSLPARLFAVLRLIISARSQLFFQNKLQILVIITFGIYLRIGNEGRLVFGDHENHKPKFHPTQFLYLSVFCLCNLPITFGQYMSAVTAFFQRIYLSRHSLAAYLLLFSGSLVIVDKFTLIHPFILADNRHFTFYINRYFIQPWLPRLALVPFYAFAINFIFKLTVNSQLKLLRFLLWFGASSAYTCMSELVQFRYFAIPFLLLSFQLQNRNFNLDVEGVHKQFNRYTTSEKMIWTTLLKVVGNAIIFSLFLYYPFNNEYGSGRFMW